MHLGREEWLVGGLGGLEKGRRGEGRTEAMKSPKAPPSAKPMTPEMAVLPGQDSMSFCICCLAGGVSSHPSS